MAEYESKWGRKTARERYGALKSPNTKPEDVHAPQRLGDSNNLHGPDYENDASGWVRAPNEDATGKPGYVPGGSRPKH